MTRIKQIAIFLGMFALILAATHFYMFERLDFYLQPTPMHRAMLAFLLGGFPCLTLVSIPLSRILPRPAASVLTWIVYPWMGIALFMFVTLVAADILWLFLQFVPASQPRELYLQQCLGVAALSITGLLGCFALWKGLAPVMVKDVGITLSRLPISFDGLRIVQITDLHIGPLINGKWLRKVVDKINALKPDIIVITGDLVDGTVEELRHHVAPLAGLRSRHGTYFITGNHEYYSGAEEWCAHVVRLGIKVLRNQRVSISSGVAEESFDLAGIDDWHSHHFPGDGPDLSKALAGRDPQKALILLAHQPAAVHEAASHGVDLQLSGHTHAGQIWPFTYLVPLQQPYSKGLHRYLDRQTQIYVSSGTGFWGPPMRLGTSAEITHITLRAGLAQY